MPDVKRAAALAADPLHIEIARQQRANDQLQRQLATANAGVEAAERDMDRHRHEATRLAAQLKETERKLAAVRAELTETELRLQSATFEIGSLQDRLTTALATNASMARVVTAVEQYSTGDKGALGDIVSAYGDYVGGTVAAPSTAEEMREHAAAFGSPLSILDMMQEREGMLAMDRDLLDTEHDDLDDAEYFAESNESLGLTREAVWQ